MIYLIYGNQRTTILSQIKKIVKTVLPTADDMNYVKFDGSNTLIQECVDEANYTPLGYDHKVVVVQDCYFLLKPRPRNKIEADQNYKELIEYLNHPNEDAEFILTVATLDIDKSSEIYKIISTKWKCIEVKDPNQEEWDSYVKQKVLAPVLANNPLFRIDRDATEELINRTAGDVALLRNSVTKLFLYTSHVRYEDVTLLVTRPLEDNAFQLFNYLINGKNEDAIALFRDLRVANTEPVTLISMLANQFRLLNEIVFLSKKGLNNDEIAAELNIKPIRVQILRKQTFTLSEEKLHKVLDSLFELDLQIKSGQVYDRYYAFELFLLNFKRN